MINWLDKLLPSLQTSVRRGSRVPEGLWVRCAGCAKALYEPELAKNMHVCPSCGHHARLGARTRLEYFLDNAPRLELATDVLPNDRLRFRDTKRYRDRLSAAQKKTKEKDALVVIQGELAGMPLVACAFEFGFLGGSMGSAVGEKFARAARRCVEKRLPLVCFSASGGARMQEALISLMQMAKTAAVLARMRRSSVPYISVLTDPVYGGVSASLASLGDINIAEPGVRSGFAGQNIIRDTLKLEQLPEGFQSSEFLLDHGLIDMIVPRRELGARIASLLAKLNHLPMP